MVTKPVSRRQYVTSKYVVLALGIALGVAVGVALASLYTWTLIGPIQASKVALAALSVCLYAEFIMTATFAASMVTPGALPAGGIGLGFMIFMGILSALLGQTAAGPWLPTALIGNANLLLSGTTGRLATGNASAASLILRPGLAAAVISAAFLLAGFARFKRQDLQ